MKGFFTKTNTSKKRRNQKSNKIQKDPCEVCGLYKKCKSPKMKYTGEGKKKILIIGEAPGCISGDSLIETAYRNKTKYPFGVAIKDLVGKKNFYVYSYDLDKKEIVLGKVKKVWRTGKKRVYKVTYSWKYNPNNKKYNSLKVSSNHQFLLREDIKSDPYKGINDGSDIYLSIDGGLKVGYSLQPFFRGNYNYSFIRSTQQDFGKDSIFLLEKKIGRKLKKGEEPHHKDGIKLNDEYSNLILHTHASHARHHMLKDNPMNNPKSRAKHKKTLGSKKYRSNMSKKMKEVLSDPIIYQQRLESIDKQRHKTSKTVKEKYENDPVFYYNYLKGRLKCFKNLDNKWLERKLEEKFPGWDIPTGNNHIIESIEYIGVEDVYDIEVKKYHNFAVNGIFVHNSKEDENWEELGYDEPTQFIGKAGQLLRRKTKPHNIDIDRDCWKINGLLCRPQRNKKPTRTQLKCCKPNIDKVIEELKPEFIWLLGGTAVESFYMERFSNLSITRWRKLCIPDKKTNAWVIPLFHPSYLLRNETDKNLESIFDKDLEWAVEQLHRTPPEFEDFESQITLLYEAQDIIDFLKEILRKKPLVFLDYETSALKPYLSKTWVDRHKIWTISINGTAFPYDYPQDSKYITWSKGAHREITKLMKRILINPKIKKAAHNLKFEYMWSKEIFGVDPVGWESCTMVTAHTIDDRTFYTGLKFLGYINHGIEGYEKEVQPYLKNKPGAPFNRLYEMPLDRLLTYNAIDTKICEKEYYHQQNILDKEKSRRKEANEFFKEGLIALARSQHEGICADYDYYIEQEDILDKDIKKIEAKILNSKEAKLFEKKTGEPLKIDKDISTKDLRTLLFDIMKLKPTKLTAKAQVPAVDHETLTKIDTPFTKRILKRRTLFKIRNTYLNQFTREIVNGKIHPFFDLHMARSFRSSSSNPNFQNIPTRDEYAKKVCRSGIIPSPGNILGFFDYGGIEVRIAACVNKDPVLIKYIKDPTTDMHRDEAMEIFMLNDKQVTKDIRFYAKNCFVFPEFYGSWYGACAEGLSENCFELETNDKISILEHLDNKGIRTYKDFEKHVQNIEKKFWNKYHVYKEWKEKTVKDYQKKGYVELITGFRRGGYLSNNQLLNTPIQGPAFHCLLWSYIQLDKYFRKTKTKLIGQIHDEAIEDIYPPEKEEVVETTIDIMCNKIREHWDWIIVPLEVESEFTSTSWYDKK